MVANAEDGEFLQARHDIGYKRDNLAKCSHSNVINGCVIILNIISINMNSLISIMSCIVVSMLILSS